MWTPRSPAAAAATLSRTVVPTRASARTKLISDAGGLSSSWIAPLESVYCTGSIESQLETRMNTNSVTASGSTNGAIFMPIAASIWLRN